MADQVHWLAGPIAYKATDGGMYPDRTFQVCKWEFIGGTAAGDLRRLNLLFNIGTRKFSSTAISITQWEKKHTRSLADFYRPTAILRHMLPKGSIAVAMKAMLRPEDIAEVMAISIRGGKPDG